MGQIHIKTFQGLRPRVDTKLLADPQAQVADNCNLRAGVIRAWKDDLTVHYPAKMDWLRSIYWLGRTYWLHWNEDVDVARSPVASNNNERVYFTGLDVPRATDLTLAANGTGEEYPLDSYKLGIPVPASAPDLTLGSGGSGSAVDRAYVYTYVSGWDEEGPPSPPEEISSVLPGQEVTVDNFASPPTDGYNITKIRIYRVVTGVTTAAYQFVAEIAVGTTSYVDTILDVNLGEDLPSTEWIGPPAEMVGIVALPNGIMAGFFDNVLCLSEPYQPHAWPARYQRTTDYPIVAIGLAGDEVLAVATQENPYLVTGSDPVSMVMDKKPHPHACLSKRSGVTLGLGFAYASPDGLFLIRENGTGLLMTGHLFTEKEWRLRNPETMHAAVHDDRYFCWHETGAIGPGVSEESIDEAGLANQQPLNVLALNETGTEQFIDYGNIQGRGMIITPAEPEAELTDLDSYAYDAFRDPGNDRLYLMTENNATPQIVEWEGEPYDRRPYTWKSKVFHTRAMAFSAAKLMGTFSETENREAAQDLGALNDAAFNEVAVNDDEYTVSAVVTPRPVTFKYYGDGGLIHTEVVSDERPFRMPSANEYIRHEMEVIGTGELEEVKVAETVDALSD